MWFQKQLMNLLPFILLIVSTLTVYSGPLDNGFVSWDDPNYLLENPYVKDLTSNNLQEIFFSFRNGNYHPLPFLSYAIEYNFFGFDPKGYHVVSLIWHTVNVVLLFILLRSLQVNTWAAFAAALLYALHPMRVEAVAWVTGRKDLMCTFFSLGMLIAYVACAKSDRCCYRWCLPFFLLALLSKGTAIVLPPILLLFDKLMGMKINKQRILQKWPYFLVALGFAGIAFAARTSFQDILYEGSYGLTDLMAIGSYRFVLYYLVRTIVPVPYLFSPYPGDTSFFDPWVITSSVIITGLMLLIVLRRWFSKRQTLGFSIFFVALVPALFLPVVGYSADRFAYFPSIGLAFCVALLFEKLVRTRLAVMTVSGLVLLVSVKMSLATIERCKVWKNSTTLYSDSISLFEGREGQERNLSRGYLNRGSAFWESGDYRAAYADFVRAVNADPTYSKPWARLGDSQVTLGDLSSAVQSYTQAIQIEPQNSAIWIGRAVALRKSGRLEQALSDSDQALRLSSDNALAYSARGLIWKEMGEYGKALADFDEVTRLEPNRYEGYFNRGFVYDRIDQKDLAARDFEMVLQLDPGNLRVRRWLAEQ